MILFLAKMVLFFGSTVNLVANLFFFCHFLLLNKFQFILLLLRMNSSQWFFLNTQTKPLKWEDSLAFLLIVDTHKGSRHNFAIINNNKMLFNIFQKLWHFSFPFYFLKCGRFGWQPEKSKCWIREEVEKETKKKADGTACVLHVKAIIWCNVVSLSSPLLFALRIRFAFLYEYVFQHIKNLTDRYQSNWLEVSDQIIWPTMQIGKRTEKQPTIQVNNNHTLYRKFL